MKHNISEVADILSSSSSVFDIQSVEQPLSIAKNIF